MVFDRGKIVSISFGKSDCTVFRKVLSTEDMAEVGVIVGTREYRAKWYGEDEEMAKACASGLEGDGSRNRKSASANQCKTMMVREFYMPDYISFHPSRTRNRSSARCIINGEESWDSISSAGGFHVPSRWNVAN